MTPEEWNAFVRTLQRNEALDPGSLAAYGPLVDQLNATVRNLADDLMRFEDEPAHCARILRELAK